MLWSFSGRPHSTSVQKKNYFGRVWTLHSEHSLNTAIFALQTGFSVLCLALPTASCFAVFSVQYFALQTGFSVLCLYSVLLCRQSFLYSVLLCRQSFLYSILLCRQAFCTVWLSVRCPLFQGWSLAASSAVHVVGQLSTVGQLYHDQTGGKNSNTLQLVHN